jgi:hypothetical protein
LHRDGHLAGFEVSAVSETEEGTGPAAVLMQGMVSAAVQGRVAMTTLTEEELRSPAVL